MQTKAGDTPLCFMLTRQAATGKTDEAQHWPRHGGVGPQAVFMLILEISMSYPGTPKFCSWGDNPTQIRSLGLMVSFSAASVGGKEWGTTLVSISRRADSTWRRRSPGRGWIGGHTATRMHLKNVVLQGNSRSRVTSITHAAIDQIIAQQTLIPLSLRVNYMSPSS